MQHLLAPIRVRPAAVATALATAGAQDGRFVFTRSVLGDATLTYSELLAGDFDVRFDFDVTGWGATTCGGGERLQLTLQGFGPDAPNSSIARIQEGHRTAWRLARRWSSAASAPAPPAACALHAPATRSRWSMP